MTVKELLESKGLTPGKDVQLCETKSKTYTGTEIKMKYLFFSKTVTVLGKETDILTLSKTATEKYNANEINLGKLETRYDEDVDLVGVVMPTTRVVVKDAKW